jgi:DNA replication and repair protein RecF
VAVRLLSVAVRDFRSYDAASAALGTGLTVISGPNGAGKSNLLEAVYFGCTGRSCRTTNDRELVRFGAPGTRVVVAAEDDAGAHQLAVGFVPGEAKRMTVDGAAVERLLDSPSRPLVSVFLPDRLELIKGVPSGRRAHLDQFLAALWPARVANRRAYAQALAQRNALLARIRAGYTAKAALDTWDAQLSTAALAVMRDRSDAIAALQPLFSEIAAQLGLDGKVALAYRPRSRASSEAELVAELYERRDGDLERGFTGHGPHRDDISLARDGRELRTYGSQGQQRLALLSLLLAERQVIAAYRDTAPLMLLDDVMSELDADRRAALVDLLRGSPGQAVITTTEAEQVPGVDLPDTTRIAVSDGRLNVEVATAAGR